MARCPQHQARSRCALSSYDAGQDRALAPDPQKPHPVGELLLARRPRSPDRRLRRRLQPLPLPREHRQSHPGGRVLRTRSSHPGRTRKDQTSDYRQSPPAAPVAGSLKYQSDAPEPPLLYPARCLKNPDDGHGHLTQPWSEPFSSSYEALDRLPGHILQVLGDLPERRCVDMLRSTVPMSQKESLMALCCRPYLTPIGIRLADRKKVAQGGLISPSRNVRLND